MSNVKNPDHYNYGNFDAWDVMIATLGVEKVIDFCEVSAMKYMLRHMMKGGDEDLAKVREMLDKYFELKDGKDLIKPFDSGFTGRKSEDYTIFLNEFLDQLEFPRSKNDSMFGWSIS